MAKRISPKPAWFRDEKERWYWHEAQDIAYRADASLIERNGSSWLVTDDGERMICEPTDRLWYRTWFVLQEEFSEHKRLWVNGRPISKPGEI